jgi:hypothetical protein
VHHAASRYERPLLLAAALVSSGCGAMTAHGSGPCPYERVSVATARREQPKQLVLVEGHYLRKNGITRICEAVIGSASPACAGSSLVVRGWEPGRGVKVHRVKNSAWTSGTVRIFGLVAGTTLRAAGCA